MSLKQLKEYQEIAVEEIVNRAKKVLENSAAKSESEKLIIFKSPTGSGKTFMMSQIISEMVEKIKNEDICFLWISLGKGDLHKQSYHSLKEEFAGFPEIYLLEQEFFGTRRTIDENEMVVVNWNKLRAKDGKTGEWKAVLMRDKETVNFRELISNTREQGRKIVMIIDESHAEAYGKRALEIREIISADLTIEMSATPFLSEGRHDSRLYEIDPTDVIKEGMIKKEIIINENIEEIAKGDMDSQQTVLKAAWDKRIELKKMLEKEKADVNPLVLIQIPTGEEGTQKREAVEKYLAELGLDESKLAIWLSEEKVNLEVLENNQSEVEFLIFKQAIDTGWDCPRAQILVRFRDTKSKTMELQTIGRILRMPEAKHYNNDKLNKAFIYTNVVPADIDFKGKEQFLRNIIKSIFVKRDESYKLLKLRSYYRNRVDYGDLTKAGFYKKFEEVFCEKFNLEINKFDYINDNIKKLSKAGVEIKNLDKQDEIVLNKKLDSKLFDNLPNEEIDFDDSMFLNLSEDDKERVFDNLIKANLNGFIPSRSMSIFQGALFKCFEKYLGIKKKNNGIIYVQNIVLNNAEVFSELFNASIVAYKPIKEKEIESKIEELEKWNNEWEVAESRNYSPEMYKPKNYGLSLYKNKNDKKAYLRLDSNVEKDFIEYLESKKDKIEWWWQNGSEHMALNFGIKYDSGKDMKQLASTFQPDFLVMYKDGQLGIYDTKGSGFQEDENKIKAEALQKYIKEENERRKNKDLIGGIIIKESGRFFINDNKEYVSFGRANRIEQSGGKEKVKNWHFFEV